MSQFIVVTFPHEASARAGIQVLKNLNSNRSIVVHSAATVTKDTKDRLSMHVASNDELGVVAAAALIGGLAGLGVGVLAAAVMAAGGAVFGASAALTSRGADKKLMEEVSHRMAKASTALVADVDVDDMEALEKQMKALGGTVRRQNHLSP